MGSEGRRLPAHSTERPARPRVLDQICAIESLVSDRPAVECRLPRRRNKEHPAARSKILPLHQPRSIALICKSCRCQLWFMPACDGIACTNRLPAPADARTWPANLPHISSLVRIRAFCPLVLTSASRPGLDPFRFMHGYFWRSCCIVGLHDWLPTAAWVL